MLYLLDADTLIRAKNEYYPMGRVPEFWAWLVFNGKLGNIKMPEEIYEEITDTKKGANGQRDELANFMDGADVKEKLLLDEEANLDLVARITYGGYTNNPTENDILTMGRDPFLLSYALQDNENRCVVTMEVSRSKKKGANRKIPDVAKDFDIQTINTFQLIQRLDFRTNWDGR